MSERLQELERLVNKLSTDVAENLYQTIQILGQVTSMSERNYQGSHSRWVSDKSAELARLLGMKKEFIFQVRIAAQLHDIGKIAFKDSALFKHPSEMNQGEYKQYTLHPQIGVEMLKGHSGFSHISELILQHHERLDGSGFPRHLKGKEIHPGALIIAVVDTYHNYVFKNSRQDRYSDHKQVVYSNTTQILNSTKDRHRAAVNYLVSKKGVLFDKKVVDVFITMIEFDRKDIGGKTVLRIPVNTVEEGMVFAEDYYTTHGLLIASRSEVITPEMRKALVRFAENGDIPHKILVLADKN